jgi:hypothetical protein
MTLYYVPSGQVTMVAATRKCMIELPATTQPLTVRKLEFMSHATAAGTLIIEIMRYTATGTGTTVVPMNIGMDRSAPAATMGTVKVNDSVLPTGLVNEVLPNWVIPLPGMYSTIDPFELSSYAPPTTLWAICFTSSLATPCRCNVWFDA